MQGLDATTIQILGAAGFGAIIGWFIYYLNRYRKGDVQFSDITTLIGAIGGASVLALFPAKSDLFGAYGLGLFAGFFGYFALLVILVAISKNFDVDFFLDGRRKRPTGDFYIPGPDEPGGGQHPMREDRQTVIVIPPEAVRLAREESDRGSLARFIGHGPDVTAICKAEWSANQTDCNLFVKAVARRVGVAVSGNADSILGQTAGTGWTQHGTDGVSASHAAAAGDFVIGGLTSQELGDAHGHVVVVVPPTGPLGHDKYPYAYWGSLNEVIRPAGGKGTTVNFSFDKTARDNVHYASYCLG